MSSEKSILKVYAPIVISILALIISIVSAFRDKIWPFELKVLAGDIAIVACGKIGKITNNIPILFPLSFINLGYSEGIIEKIAFKRIDSQENVKIYIPLIEIDFVKLIRRQPPKIHADNMLDVFSLFSIQPKQSLKKYLVFTQELESKEYPFSDKWIPGKHNFELYIKTTEWKKPKKICEFEQPITAKAIQDYFKGKSTFVMLHKIELE